MYSPHKGIFVRHKYPGHTNISTAKYSLKITILNVESDGSHTRCMTANKNWSSKDERNVKCYFWTFQNNLQNQIAPVKWAVPAPVKIATMSRKDESLTEAWIFNRMVFQTSRLLVFIGRELSMPHDSMTLFSYIMYFAKQKFPKARFSFRW